MRIRTSLLLTVFVLGGLVLQAEADIVYPARLQIDEAEPGVFQIVFTMPLVQGRILRAEPLLPPSCSDITAREVVTTRSGRTSTWSVRCEPPWLAGEAIIVNGLFGTQTDLAFKLTTLDGRQFDRILRPSRPGFLVPATPSLSTLATDSTTASMRTILTSVPLWLLLLTMSMNRKCFTDYAAAAAAFAFSYAVGQWMQSQGWLGVSSTTRDTVMLFTVLVSSAGLAGAGKRWRGWLEPLWPFCLLLGALYGGADLIDQSVTTLPTSLQKLSTLLNGVGAGLGFILCGGIFLEARKIALSLLKKHRIDRLRAILATAIGGLSAGILLAIVIGYLLVPSGLQSVSTDLLLFAWVLGLSLGITGHETKKTLPLFAFLASIGTALGLARWALPSGGIIVFGSLIALGTTLAFGTKLQGRWLAVVTILATTAHTWSAANSLAGNTSRAPAVAIGWVAVSLCTMYAGLAVGRQCAGDGSIPPGLRLFGAATASYGLVARCLQYRTWFDQQIATEAAVGILRVPLLASALLVAALLVWPRRHRSLRALGIEPPRRIAHLMLAAAAFLFIPVGTMALSNPFFSAGAPTGDNARRVMEDVLSKTYEAFNLKDEDELFDRLGNTVAADMVGDLYLDSRRRLMAGTREGTEVTVREVRVLEIGDPETAYQKDGTITYDCRWIVVARVRHLQHIHHRRNTYSGRVNLTLEDRRWKIAGIGLDSEDRSIVGWGIG